MQTEYKFICFENDGEVWACRNKKDRNELGDISHYPRWKQYVFEANSNCVFSASCLQDIAAFLRQLNGEEK